MQSYPINESKAQTNEPELPGVRPPENFMGLFTLLSDSQKENVKVGIYSSVNGCTLHDDEEIVDKRMIDGKPGRCADILSGKIDIGIPFNLKVEDVSRTDEQILLGPNKFERQPGVVSYIKKLQDPLLGKFLEIYIDSSRMHKLAIIKYLGSFVPMSGDLPTRPASEQVSRLLGGETPYGSPSRL